MGCSTLRFPCPSPTPRSFLKLMSIELVMPSNHLILCHLLLILPSIFHSIRWPKYWRSSISSSNENSGLISFGVDWFDLTAVQGTLKSSHHSPKASVLQLSAFFIVQLLPLYITTGKTIALSIQTFISKVISLFFNTLSRFVMFFFQGACVF